MNSSTRVQALPQRVMDSTGGGMPTADDPDHDGLTTAEETAIGTDPANPDTDGDALLDGWEVHGINGIDLAGMGANPLRKDIFVEMDYMVRASATNGLGPNADALDGIRQASADADVSNPDGSTGISIHLDEGNEVPWDNDLDPPTTEFAALKNTHFDMNRLPVFHYMIWADRYDGGTSSGNSFAIPNSDFMSRWVRGGMAPGERTARRSALSFTSLGTTWASVMGVAITLVTSPIT